MTQAKQDPATVRSAAGPAGRAARLPDAWHVLLVAAGGMIGTTLRYGFTVAFPTDPGRFPLTTFAENVSGAFLLGLLLVLILERWRPTPHLHPLLCTGILGSFTTFSNFSVELVALGQAGHAAVAVVYAVASVMAGLTAALLGMSLARTWPPVRPQPHAHRRREEPT